MLQGIRFAVLITSDRGASGEREDVAGPLLRNLVEENGGTCLEVTVVPDDWSRIQEFVREKAGRTDVDVILTSGGTGIGPRDVTVDAVRALMEKEMAGFGEEMRRRSLEKTPMAILSRATAGTVGSKIVLTLPGSPTGAVECLAWVMKPLAHAVRILKKEIQDCQKALKEPNTP